MANTPHFRGSKFHTQLVTGRRYMLDVMSSLGQMHPEKTSIHLGQAMRANEWVEIATNPLAAFPKTHVEPGVRPLGSLPFGFALDGIDGNSYYATRAYKKSDETFAGRRQLMTGSVTYEPQRQQAVMRLVGPPDCIAARDCALPRTHESQ